MPSGPRRSTRAARARRRRSRSDRLARRSTPRGRRSPRARDVRHRAPSNAGLPKLLADRQEFGVPVSRTKCLHLGSTACNRPSERAAPGPHGGAAPTSIGVSRYPFMPESEPCRVAGSDDARSSGASTTSTSSDQSPATSLAALPECHVPAVAPSPGSVERRGRRPSGTGRPRGTGTGPGSRRTRPRVPIAFMIAW